MNEKGRAGKGRHILEGRKGDSEIDGERREKGVMKKERKGSRGKN